MIKLTTEYEFSNNCNLLYELADRNKSFSYEEFMQKDYKSSEDWGASCIITNNQVITVLNNNDGKGSHYETQLSIWNAMYDLQMSNNQDNITTKEELKKFQQDQIFAYYREEEHIIMRIVNDKSGNAIIAVLFPNTITTSQLALLEAYKAKYGHIIEKIGNEKHQKKDDGIIIFKPKNKSEVHTNKFEDVVTYAKSITDNNKEILKEKFLIGYSLEELKSITSKKIRH